MALGQSNQQTELRFPIVVPEMTVQSMRASGYKSTTHALSELIDNSIESGADIIEVFGLSRIHESTGRLTLQELAVLDNGSGMDALQLWGALCYGLGTRQDRRGIGRFGMGLPNSSMSQARCLDVWSWQAGVTNSLHTRLHLNEVEQGLKEIPEPQIQPLPDAYLDASPNGFGDSGTLVVWRELDRVEWRRVSTTFKHTENLLGRIYRRFLAEESHRLHPADGRNDEIGAPRTILLVPVDERPDGTIEVADDDIVQVRPNDPLYLMPDTSCPEDFGQGPMFKELEGFSPFSLPIAYDGKEYLLRVRASHVRTHARNPDSPEADWPDSYVAMDAGNTPWGKHAAHNLGISIMRAHREIHLDDTWTSRYDPVDRWWTIEVDFPPELDEVFGVTFTKQGAPTFPRLAAFDWRREAFEDESLADVLTRMRETGEYRDRLIDLHQQLTRCINVLRKRVAETRRRRGPRHEEQPTEETKADTQATVVIERRESEGLEGTSDKKGKTGTADEHKQEQIDSLTKKHQMDAEAALDKVDETMRTGNRVRWIQSELNSPAFFDVEPLPNVVQVVFNKQHPVHTHFWEVMHPDQDGEEELSADELQERLERAAMAFRVLIYSWARYEEEQTERALRAVRNARIEWGKYAEDFFDVDDDSPTPTDLV